MRRTRVFASKNYMSVTIWIANLGSIFREWKKVRRTQARWVDDIRIFDWLIGPGAYQSSFASLTLKLTPGIIHNTDMAHPSHLFLGCPEEQEPKIGFALSPTEAAVQCLALNEGNFSVPKGSPR